jgi:hypothetical protein
MPLGLARLWSVVILAPWLLALWAPYQVSGYDAPGPQPHGCWLLLVGWLGPLTANFGWFANLLLAKSVARLAMGRPPGGRSALGGLALALSALLPAWIFDVDTDGGFHANLIRGEAVLWWLTAFVGLAFAGLIFRPLRAWNIGPLDGEKGERAKP